MSPAKDKHGYPTSCELATARGIAMAINILITEKEGLVTRQGTRRELAAINRLSIAINYAHKAQKIMLHEDAT